MAATTSEWKRLNPGDHVRVCSHSGHSYEATIVYAGQDVGGSLYVRLANGKLARLLTGRVNWKTVERLGAAPALKPGDEVIVVALGGVERRGKLAAPIDDRVRLNSAPGQSYSVPLAETQVKKFRLLFPAEDLRKGDEFLVKSKSGTEYRGLVVRTEPDRIVASLRPSKERVTLLLERLDMKTLFVLVPLMGASPTWE